MTSDEAESRDLKRIKTDEIVISVGETQAMGQVSIPIVFLIPNSTQLFISLQINKLFLIGFSSSLRLISRLRAFIITNHWKQDK